MERKMTNKLVYDDLKLGEKGVDFVGFRNFYYYNLLRKRNIHNMQRKINSFNKEEISYETLFDSFQGWSAYAK